MHQFKTLSTKFIINSKCLSQSQAELNQQDKLNQNVKVKTLNQQSKINDKIFVYNIRPNLHQQQGKILLPALKHLDKTYHIAQVQALLQQGNKP